MKIITIGRGDGCTIQIDNEFISRQHALLRLYPTGKIELIDKSSNGTSINGRRIKPNIPYKVRRKDVVTFAGQAQLVWSDVPDPMKAWKIAGICLLVMLAVIGGLYAFQDKLQKKPQVIQGGVPTPAITDTTKRAQETPKAALAPENENKEEAKDSKKNDKVREIERRARQKKAEQERKQKESATEQKKAEGEKKAKSDTANMNLFLLN